MIEQIMSFVTPYLLKGIISLFIKNDITIENYALNCIWKSNDEFKKNYGDKYGDPLDLFYNSAANQRIIIQSLYHHAGILNANELNAEGFNNAKTVDREALYEYTKILERNLRENQEIDAIYTLKERHEELRSGLAELRKLYEKSLTHSLEVSVELESKLDKYLDRLYIPPENRNKVRPLDFSLFSLPIYLVENSIELDHFSKIIRPEINRIVLLGEPASGKTTAIKRIINTAKEQLDPKIIPIRIDYEDIKLPQGLKEKTKILLTINDVDFDRLRLSKRFLFIYDGLNEPESDTRNKAELISKRCEEYIESLFLVSCRTNEYSKHCSSLSGRFTSFTIKRLDQTLQIDFLKKVSSSEIDNSSRQQLISLFEANSEYSNICNTQFIFLLFLRNFKRDEKLPTSISSIYSSFLTDYLEMEEERHINREHIDKISKLSLLSQIAFIMSKANKIEIEENELFDLIECNIHLETKSVFDALLTNGLLLRCGNKNQRIKFYQQTLQDFLLAYWFDHHNIYPIDMTIDDTDTVMFRNDFEIPDFSLRRYEEMTKILSLQDILKKIKKKADGMAQEQIDIRN